MVAPEDIKWGSYKNFSGPFYWGRHKLKLPENHDMLDEMVYLTSLIEGNADSINGYDSCIMTIGAIQWCDRAPIFAATKLLGFVAEDHSDLGHVQKCLDPALKASNAAFKPHPRGGWRFYLDGGTREVKTQADQKELYFGGASGKKDGWTKETKERAKLWAACIANVFEDKEARAIQLQYTKSRMLQFAVRGAQQILFDDDDSTLTDAHPGWVRAARVTYITFAVNNPTWAWQSLQEAMTSEEPKWSPAWVVNFMRIMTGKHRINPHRYERIRPFLEELYGIDLPNTAEELARGDLFRTASGGLYSSLKDVQRALEYVGHDPGPIDGKMGSRTRQAVREFQADEGLEPTGRLTGSTIGALAKIESDTRRAEKMLEAEAAVPDPDPVHPAMEDTMASMDYIVPPTIENQIQKIEGEEQVRSPILTFFKTLFGFFSRFFG